MTARYRVLPAADRDLDDQADYLSREAGIEIALRFYDAARSSLAHWKSARRHHFPTLDSETISSNHHGKKTAGKQT